jgi:hypothetical protein
MYRLGSSSPPQALGLAQELLHAEVDDIILSLAAKRELLSQDLHLALKIVDLLLVGGQSRLKLGVQGIVQALLDLVAIRLIGCLLPSLDQIVD